MIRNSLLLAACALLACQLGCDRQARDSSPDAPPVALTPEQKLYAERLEAACPGSTDPSKTNGKERCTEIGCPRMLEVALPDALVARPGAYTITLTSRDVTATCTGSFPVASCDEAWECSHPEMLLTNVSGCAMGADSQEIMDLMVRDYPLEASVTVARDGEELLARTFTPEYVSNQPNGEGCGPVCCSATVELSP